MSAADLRKLYAQRRDALSPAERLAKSEQIWKRLVELPVFQGARQALFYVSFKSEVDTGLMRSLSRGLGMAVAAPRSAPGSRDMAFHSLGREERLEAGAFGLLQPGPDPHSLVELPGSVVLVPGLVFDLKGNRLGWGGGYYDKFLGDEGKGLPSVGLAFDIQVADSLPAQAHDVPVHFIVTESRTLDCSQFRI